MVWSFLVATSTAAAAAEPLLASVAKADITPKPGLPMWGYSGRTAGAEGTLDPLMAKCLVLKSPREAVAIVTLDLGRVPEETVLEDARQRIHAECGISNLFVTASHTHQAPSLESIGGVPNEYGQSVGAAIAKIVVQAADQLVPVKIGVAQGEADLGHNRRRLLPDGRVAMQWRNAERDPTAPVDRQFTVIRVDREDGTSLAVLYHYACHPVVLGADNLRYSADYVGQAAAVVEAGLDTTCLFLQGACGDINPYVDKTPLVHGGVEEMRKMGTELGQLVEQTARNTKTALVTEPALRFHQQSIPLKVRWDLQNPDARAVLSRAYGRRFDQYLAPRLEGGIVSAPLAVLLIGDDVALVGMPGEVFVQFQLDLKARSLVPHTLLVGYTNGYHAYFPTIRDAAAGGYGGKTATYVEVGAGERLLNQGLVTIYRLTDRLHDLPREEDFRLIEWDEIKPRKADTKAASP